MKNKIGGEIPLPQDNLYSYITDSGRSSLRLILHTLRDKKFALPDFLCSVIIDVFDEMGVEYYFYTPENFLPGIGTIGIDVYYDISYFGQKIEYIGFNNKLKHIIVLQDLAFSPFVKKPPNVENWIGFNSLRKISPLTEGSIVRSTIELSAKEICVWAQAPFVYFKKENQWKVGEKILDKQKCIYSISNPTLFALFDFYQNIENERRERQINFNTLKSFIRVNQLEIKPDFPSFFPILVDKRDELRAWLRQSNIFLPVHWPKHPKAPDNPLYDTIISIPVDSRYTIVDMERVANLINGFYGV